MKNKKILRTPYAREVDALTPRYVWRYKGCCGSLYGMNSMNAPKNTVSASRIGGCLPGNIGAAIIQARARKIHTPEPCRWERAGQCTAASMLRKYIHAPVADELAPGNCICASYIVKSAPSKCITARLVGESAASKYIHVCLVGKRKYMRASRVCARVCFAVLTVNKRLQCLTFSLHGFVRKCDILTENGKNASYKQLVYLSKYFSKVDFIPLKSACLENSQLLIPTGFVQISNIPAENWWNWYYKKLLMSL